MNYKDFIERSSRLGYTPENLRQLLKEHQMTQSDCAKLLDVTPRTVNRWCRLGDDIHSGDMPIGMPYFQWLRLLWHLEQNKD